MRSKITTLLTDNYENKPRVIIYTWTIALIAFLLIIRSKMNKETIWHYGYDHSIVTICIFIFSDLFIPKKQFNLGILIIYTIGLVFVSVEKKYKYSIIDLISLVLFVFSAIVANQFVKNRLFRASTIAISFYFAREITDFSNNCYFDYIGLFGPITSLGLYTALL